MMPWRSRDQASGNDDLMTVMIMRMTTMVMTVMGGRCCPESNILAIIKRWCEGLGESDCKLRRRWWLRCVEKNFDLVMMMTMKMMKMITMVWRWVASVTTLESGRVTRGPLTQHEHTLANTNTIERQAQIKLKDKHKYNTNTNKNTYNAQSPNSVRANSCTVRFCLLSVSLSVFLLHLYLQDLQMQMQ